MNEIQRKVGRCVVIHSPKCDPPLPAPSPFELLYKMETVTHVCAILHLGKTITLQTRTPILDHYWQLKLFQSFHWDKTIFKHPAMRRMMESEFTTHAMESLLITAKQERWRKRTITCSNAHLCVWEGGRYACVCAREREKERERGNLESLQ